MRLAFLLALLVACAGAEGPRDTGDTPSSDSGGPDDTDPCGTDPDCDGYGSGEDCDDDDGTIHPGAVEVCDGVDQDCDGAIDEDALATFHADADGDGAGDPSAPELACAAPEGFVANDADCDDTDATIGPAAAETCDGVDQDCDGTPDDDATDAPAWHPDADADGFGDPGVTVTACEAPAGWLPAAADCDDTDATVFPGAVETCDGDDDDCDGEVDEDALDPSTWYLDRDGDGYGDATNDPAVACAAPPRHVGDATDCDDADFDRHPGAAELCDGGDDDCDGVIDDGALDALTLYVDADGDGYGDPAAPFRNCVELDGYAAVAEDCDDADPAAWPGAPEVCGDGVDQDCDGDAGTCAR